MSRSRTQTPLQKELVHFGKLTATEKADAQTSIWNRTKAEIVTDLEKFKHEGDAFFEKPAGGWSKLTAGGAKAMLNRMYQLPFPTNVCKKSYVILNEILKLQFLSH
jgi:hypothetical protein